MYFSKHVPIHFVVVVVVVRTKHVCHVNPLTTRSDSCWNTHIEVITTPTFQFVMFGVSRMFDRASDSMSAGRM